MPLSSHVRTHLGAPRTVIEVLDRFGSDEGVTVAIFENASTGGEAGLIRRDRAWLESLRRPVAAELLRELRERLERERQAGRINAAVYEGTMSPEARGE